MTQSLQTKRRSSVPNYLTTHNGYDRIFGFEAGAGSNDVVDISAFGFADFTQVQAVAFVAGNYVIVQLDADDSVGFYGLTDVNQLHENDFII